MQPIKSSSPVRCLTVTCSTLTHAQCQTKISDRSRTHTGTRGHLVQVQACHLNQRDCTAARLQERGSPLAPRGRAGRSWPTWSRWSAWPSQSSASARRSGPRHGMTRHQRQESSPMADYLPCMLGPCEWRDLKLARAVSREHSRTPRRLGSCTSRRAC